MPLVRIDLAAGRGSEFTRRLGDLVYRAMADVIDIPPDDKFQIITEHPRHALNFAPSFLGIEHSDALVMIQITLSFGRSVEKKQALYRRIAGDLARELAIRPQDVFINLVETARENWSFGNGIAQYVA